MILNHSVAAVMLAVTLAACTSRSDRIAMMAAEARSLSAEAAQVQTMADRRVVSKAYAAGQLQQAREALQACARQSARQAPPVRPWVDQALSSLQRRDAAGLAAAAHGLQRLERSNGRAA